MNSKRNKNKKGQNQRKVNPITERKLTTPTSVVHRPFPYLPDQYRVRVVYNTIGTMINAASPTVMSNYTPNYLGQLDSSFGSTAEPGVSALSTIWTQTRVLGGRITVAYTNLQSVPQMVGGLYSNTVQLSASGLYIKSGDRSSSFRRGYNTQLSASAQFGCRKVITTNFSTTEVSGSNAALTADSFAATGLASPADLIHFTIFADTGSAVNQSSGVRYHITIEVDVLFTQRASLTV